eukprot:1161367-Pelagomonas_calceolata.AAC.3
MLAMYSLCTFRGRAPAVSKGRRDIARASSVGLASVVTDDISFSDVSGDVEFSDVEVSCDAVDVTIWGC